LLAGAPSVVFQGGPVSLDSALGLAVVPGESRDGQDGEPLGWRRVHGAIGLVDLEAPPELLASELGSLRIFAGYAGWGPGQLEDELIEGAWYVVESEPGDVSAPDPEQLWRSVLRRQRSELAMVATYPDDPSLN
jgi:putative transcriptional regulator